MKTEMKGVNMRTKILWICILSTLFAMVLQTVFFQYSSSRIIYKQEKDINLNTLRNLQNDIFAYSKNIENCLIKVYNHKDFIKALSTGKNMDDLKKSYSQVSYDMALTVFEPNQNVNAIYIYDLSNHLISSYRHAQTPRYTYPEDIYDGTMKNNEDTVQRYVNSDNKVMLISSYYNDKRKTDLVRFVLKIYKSNTNKKIGYIVCDVDSKIFLNFVQKNIYSDGQVIWLQPTGDRVALHAGTITEKQQTNYQNAVNLITKGNWASNQLITNPDDVLFEVDQTKYNLTAYSLMPQLLMEQNQLILDRNMIVIAFFIIMVFSICSYSLSKSITTPLTYMVRTMEQIKRGNTSLRLKRMKQDEIGILGQEFNDMLDQIQILIKQEYEAKLLANNAKYKALQAQVNPHFLYNTLDTMSGIAASQNCLTVSNMCKALSNIFRYSIDMSDPLSTIEQEIIHIKNYMYVINTRVQNGIKLQIDIDSALLNERLPRISIQPLVENAIQHGLKDKRGEKRIRIDAQMTAQYLAVSVTDNGVGMDADQIRRQLADDAPSALDKRTSIGLSNINARLKLLFGKEYGIDVESIVGEGSKVSLLLPRMREANDHG